MACGCSRREDIEEREEVGCIRFWKGASNDAVTKRLREWYDLYSYVCEYCPLPRLMRDKITQIDMFVLANLDWAKHDAWRVAHEAMPDAENGINMDLARVPIWNLNLNGHDTAVPPSTPTKITYPPCLHCYSTEHQASINFTGFMIHDDSGSCKLGDFGVFRLGESSKSGATPLVKPHLARLIYF